MGYKNSSLRGIVKGKVTKEGQPVIQGKDVFPSAYTGPKKAKAKGRTTNHVNDNRA